jgi:hypothetical protein
MRVATNPTAPIVASIAVAIVGASVIADNMLFLIACPNKDVAKMRVSLVGNCETDRNFLKSLVQKCKFFVFLKFSI